MLKKVFTSEKVAIARQYRGMGLRRDNALALLGITRHALYYRPRKGRRGRKPNEKTINLNSKGNRKNGQ